jgi:NMD protein affecting ribosome stability and mRNA decay
VAALLPSTREGRQQAECERETQLELHESREMRPCPRCGRQNSVVTPVCPRCEYRYS